MLICLLYLLTYLVLMTLCGLLETTLLKHLLDLFLRTLSLVQIETTLLSLLLRAAFFLLFLYLFLSSVMYLAPLVVNSSLSILFLKAAFFLASFCLASWFLSLRMLVLILLHELVLMVLTTLPGITLLMTLLLIVLTLLDLQ